MEMIKVISSPFKKRQLSICVLGCFARKERKWTENGIAVFQWNYVCLRLFNRILNFYLHSLFRFSLYFFIFSHFGYSTVCHSISLWSIHRLTEYFVFFIMMLFDFELGQIRFCAKLIYYWKQNIPSVRCLCHFDQSLRLRIIFARSFYINAFLLVRTVLIISFNRSMPFTWQKALKW